SRRLAVATKSTVPKPGRSGQPGRPLSAQWKSAQPFVFSHGKTTSALSKNNPRNHQSLVFPTLQAVQGLEDLPRSRQDGLSRAEEDGGDAVAVKHGLMAMRGDVAQLGEHLLCKQGVGGSSPLISTMHVDNRI